MRRKIVYVSGKFVGETEYDSHVNVDHVHRQGFELLKKGYVVIFPCWVGRFIPAADILDRERRAYWSDIVVGSDEELITRCADAIYMCEGWEASPGARREREAAVKAGKEIMYEKGSDN